MKNGCFLYLLMLAVVVSIEAQDKQPAPVADYRQKLHELARQLGELEKQQQDIQRDPRQQLEQEMAELARLRQLYQTMHDSLPAPRKPAPEIARTWVQGLLSKPDKTMVVEMPKKWLALADLYAQQKRYSEAAAAYLEYDRREGKLSAIQRYRLAYACEKNGDWASAEDHYRQLAGEHADTYLGNQGTWRLHYLRWKKSTLERLAQHIPPTEPPNKPENKESSALPPVAQPPALAKALPPVAQPPALAKALPPVAQPPALAKALPLVAQPPVPVEQPKTQSKPTVNVAAKPATATPSAPGKWYRQLAVQLDRLRALDLTQWPVSETRLTIEANKIDGYVKTMANYPKEIQRLASDLQQCLQRGKDVAVWIKSQTATAASQNKIEQLKMLQAFWQNGELDLQVEAEVAALSGEIDRLAAIDRQQQVTQADMFHNLRRMLEKIHEQYEQASQLLTSAITNMQMAD